MSSEPQHTSDSVSGSAQSVPSIPLSEERSGQGAGDQSIGNLVRDASAHVSTLVRAEIELARSEITSEAKKGVKGSLFFIVALTIVLFSLFFLFFALGELLADIGLYRSAAFGIVFGAMVLIAGIFALLGWLKVRKIRAPERTISSMKDTAASLTSRPSPDGHAVGPADRTGADALTGARAGKHARD